jgi:hypothetical protein
MSDPSALAQTLLAVDEHEYVRFSAHWMTGATSLDTAPELTGNEVIDALVAASAAFVAYQRSAVEPEWTYQPGRALKNRIWHPGASGMLPYSLVHAPGSFIVRGVVVSRDALSCV